MRNLKLISLAILAVFMFSGFWSANDTDDDRRAGRVIDNRQSLELLYEYKASTQEEIKSAYGYATFKSVGLNMMIFSAEGGYGLAHNNVTGENTFMDMVSGGMGVGLGVKDFRIIFIFENKKEFDRFLEKGWEANAQIDVAAKADSDGDSLNESITIRDGVELYKVTENGLAMQITIQGSKYWKDKTLN